MHRHQIIVHFFTAAGSRDNAILVSEGICNPSAFSWNVMIREYAHRDLCREALTVYYQMRGAGIRPDGFTFPLALKACVGPSALQDGKRIHHHILTTGFAADVFAATALTRMYAKCGRVQYARQVFDEMPIRDAALWNAMIAGYAQNGHSGEALTLFNQMQLAGATPDSITMTSLLQACSCLGALQPAAQIHNYIIRRELGSDIIVDTALVDVYSQCKHTEIARRVFDKMPNRNVVSWSTMIAGYARSGYAREALRLFNQMLMAGMNPNSFTVASVLSASALLGSLQVGKCIHGCIIKREVDSNVFVVNSLIDMYSKCGNIETACHLFAKMFERDAVSWNAMIAGYVQNGHCNQALELFNEMQSENVTPDSVTVVSALQACAYLGALQQGRRVHDYVIQCGFESDPFVGTALIDMYSKCGRTDIAHQLFDKFSKISVASWNAMIVGFTQNGYATEALTLFNQMSSMDLQPNLVTMLSVLPACAQLAALQEAMQAY